MIRWHGNGQWSMTMGNSHRQQQPTPASIVQQGELFPKAQQSAMNYHRGRGDFDFGNSGSDIREYPASVIFVPLLTRWCSQTILDSAKTCMSGLRICIFKRAVANWRSDKNKQSWILTQGWVSHKVQLRQVIESNFLNLPWKANRGPAAVSQPDSLDQKKPNSSKGEQPGAESFKVSPTGPADDGRQTKLGC